MRNFAADNDDAVPYVRRFVRFLALIRPREGYDEMDDNFRTVYYFSSAVCVLGHVVRVCVGGGLWQCFAGVGFGRVFFLASVLFS